MGEGKGGRGRELVGRRAGAGEEGRRAIVERVVSSKQMSNLHPQLQQEWGGLGRGGRKEREEVVVV